MFAVFASPLLLATLLPSAFAIFPRPAQLPCSSTHRPEQGNWPAGGARAARAGLLPHTAVFYAPDGSVTARVDLGLGLPPGAHPVVEAYSGGVALRGAGGQVTLAAAGNVSVTLRHAQQEQVCASATAGPRLSLLLPAPAGARGTAAPAKEESPPPPKVEDASVHVQPKLQKAHQVLSRPAPSRAILAMPWGRFLCTFLCQPPQQQQQQQQPCRQTTFPAEADDSPVHVQPELQKAHQALLPAFACLPFMRTGFVSCLRYALPWHDCHLSTGAGPARGPEGTPGLPLSRHWVPLPSTPLPRLAVPLLHCQSSDHPIGGTPALQMGPAQIPAQAHKHKVQVARLPPVLMASSWHDPPDRAPASGSLNAVVRSMSGKGNTMQAVVGDRPALEALYLATGGEQWKSNSNWMGAGPVCDWKYMVEVAGGQFPALVAGVVDCIEGTQQVTTLILSNNQLSGPLPEAIGQMTALKEIRLNDKQLSGTLPESMGQMIALEILSLDGNQLSGTLPDSITQMTALRYITLFNNQLNGTLPDSIGQLTALGFLSLTSNQLSGTLPEILGQMTGLDTLRLDKNKFTGMFLNSLWPTPEKQYRSLLLSGNHWTCPLPSEQHSWQDSSDTRCIWLDYRSALEDLYRQTSGNGWFDSTGWASNTSVCAWNGVLCNDNRQPTGITLPGNNLTGPLPDSVVRIPVLEVLDLKDNRIQSLPAALSAATRLARLDLRSNGLSGPLPDFCDQAGDTTAYALSQLDLSNNIITGSVPASLSLCQSLSALDLSHNQLSGTLDTGLGRLCLLSRVDVSFNVLDHFADLSGKSAALPCPITGDTADNATATFPAAVSIDLSHNIFSGPFPKEEQLTLHQARQLQFLDLSNNSFTGDLPWLVPRGGESSRLRVASLGFNQFSGVISATGPFPRDSSLQTLDLRSNLLEGSGEDWPTPESLQLLLIDNNPLQGSLGTFLLVLSITATNKSVSQTRPQFAMTLDPTVDGGWDCPVPRPADYPAWKDWQAVFC
eukprot:gene2945-biopygen3127